MNAIPTIYNGCKFRSKLEARWAIFFDRMKIKYEYEPHTFSLNGLYYLPDFLLPSLFNIPVYVEVKPDINGRPGEWETLIDHEDFNKKWYEFAKERALLLLFGPPSDTDFHLIRTPYGENNESAFHAIFNFSSTCKFRQVFLNEIVYSKRYKL